MKTIYKLRCIAPDGESVNASRFDFDTVEAAWEEAGDMGSRWFFYPISVVTTSSQRAARSIIRGVPDGMGKHWIGRQFGTLCKAIAENASEVCDWINGEAPCPI